MSGKNRAFKLKLLLAIDTAFLFLELGVGTAVGSLALVADSFHMLNDVCSLVVALQALKLAENSAASAKLSYGWQRAEVLGALINGVFLLALCFSIAMEALARFINYTEVTQPKLIVAVGTAGLLSNIIGLFLFHDHGHSHGGGGHGHSHGGSSSHASKKKSKSSHSHSHAEPAGESERATLLTPSSSTPRASSPPRSVRRSASASSTAVSSAASENGEEDDAALNAEDDLLVHPGELRAQVVAIAHKAGYGATHEAHGESAHGHEGEHDEEEEIGGHGHLHGGHGGHGAKEGDMNMRGVFLHVLGDALGNVGVIAAGLFIWLTDYRWKMYTDPGISLVITIIIFSSALPLVRSASFILLQGVPSSVPLDRLRSSIASVPGVINVHDLHVWSLSESKIVASVHIMVRGNDLVTVSKEIKRRFHRFGIHSSTIQPEIVATSLPSAPGAPATSSFSSGPSGPTTPSYAAITAGGSSSPSPSAGPATEDSHISSAAAASRGLVEEGCPVLCVDESCAADSCCPPGMVSQTQTVSTSQA
ncbi:hypothetical protein JCM11641_006943 [Rhodosporidiobolus odoratus]